MTLLKLAIAGVTEGLIEKNNRLIFAVQSLLAVLLLSLTLLMGSVQFYLGKNLDALLGADMVLETRAALSPSERDFLAARAHALSETRIMPLNLTHGERWARVEVKFVDAAYPVQGVVRLSPALGAPAVDRSAPPAPGEIWVDSRTASHLAIKVGDVLAVAGTRFRVGAILTHEPDRLSEGHSVEMRAVARFDAAGFAARVDQPIKHRTLMVADETTRQEIKAWHAHRMDTSRLIDRHAGQHPFASFWERVENFLGLTFILLVFMGVIAINLASRPKLEAMAHRLAVMFSMGLTRRRGQRLMGLAWLLECCLILITGLAVALALHLGLVGYLDGRFPGIEARVDPAALAQTLSLLCLLFLSLQAPLFMDLRRASVLSLIRQSASGQSGMVRVLWGGLAVGLVAVVYTDNGLLTALVLGTMALVLGLLGLLSWGALSLAARLTRSRPGLWSFVFFLLRQRLGAKAMQIIGLGLSATLLLVAMGLVKDVRGTLYSEIRASNGNLLVSDVADPALPALKQWVAESNSALLVLRPFVHASLVAVNGARLADFAAQPSGTRTRLERPIRLSWRADMPANNRLLDGVWWQAEDENWRQISVEDEVMTDLGLRFGDRLTFQLGVQRLTFEIVARHGFRSGASSVTFWFQVPQKARKHMALGTHHMGGIEVTDAGWESLGALLARVPELHVAPLRDITDRLDAALDLARTASMVFGMVILLLALLVIVASVSGFEAEDRKRNGLLLSMGLSRADCVRVTLYEWGVTALIAGGGSLVGTYVMGSLLYDQQLAMPYKPDLSLYAGLLLATCVTVTALGLAVCRAQMRVSVRAQLMAG